MSFTQNVKKEILSNVKKMKGCCATSFLTAVLRAIGSICVDAFGYCFSLDSDNGDLLMFCSKLCQDRLGVETTVYQIEQKDKSVRYSCKFGLELGEKLQLVYRDAEGCVHLDEQPKLNLQNNCCRRSFIQGLFLACGSALIPDSGDDAFAESRHSHYHLELRLSNENFAQFILEEFPELELRQVQRKNNVILYLKDSNKIADFFVVADAVNAKFTVENTIISRSYRNTANRQRNCIDSNIDKAIAAAVKQLEAIAKIRKSGKFNILPQALQDVAVAREENHDANLSELAAILGISKSGVNHRLAKLIEIADQL